MRMLQRYLLAYKAWLRGYKCGAELGVGTRRHRQQQRRYKAGSETKASSECHGSRYKEKRWHKADKESERLAVGDHS